MEMLTDLLTAVGGIFTGIVDLLKGLFSIPL